MAKWELMMHNVSTSVWKEREEDPFSGGPAHWQRDPTLIWARKGKEGRSAFDRLQEYAAQGWELVSVTPFSRSGGGETTSLVFTFKRPLEEP